MLVATGTWESILAHNLRIAAALWAAWAGGASTVIQGRIKICAQSIVLNDGLNTLEGFRSALLTGTDIGIEDDVDAVDAKPQRHLTLVE